MQQKFLHLNSHNTTSLLRKSTFTLFFLFLTISPLFLTAQSSLDTAIEYLNKTKDEQGFTLQDIEHPKITDEYTSKHNQVTHLYLKQTHKGLEVSNATANLAILRNGKVANAYVHFIPNLSEKINMEEPVLSAEEALEKAILHLKIPFRQQIKPSKEVSNVEKMTIFEDNTISREPIPVRLVYFLTSEGKVRLTWDLSISMVKNSDWWSMKIDAETGEVLYQHNWTTYCEWDVPHDHAACESANIPASIKKPAPTSANAAPVLANTYNVYAIPVESPNHGGRTIVSSPWTADGGVASPFGWHDTNGANGAEYTITRGNNVYAAEDRDNNNVPGNAPNGTASLDFNFPINLNNAPATYEDAAITNLFYWNNVMHDVWYQYGFDEASGNFQSNNYGRGGAGNDYVEADAQDGGGTNNANFSTPPDGTNGRMQMYEWTSSATVNFTVNSPGGVAGSYGALPAGFGGALPISPSMLTGNLVIADDGTAAPSEACNPLINTTAINGNIALVDRGNCNFTVKVKNAQDAGAIACVVCNNVAGGPIAMGGTDPTVTIPAVMISQADCAAIRAAIPTVNISLSSTGTTANIDGDLDNGIIAHEYGHGISIRLAGGPSNSGCLSNTEQMGEGWSDWFGLMMTIEAGDVGGDVRGVGTFAQNQPTNGTGIRPAPYSTNTAINPYTYGNVGSQAVPHGVGFVWSTMLWDMTWALIGQYGWDPDLYNGTGGNNIAMQLVIDGIKLQPCSPGFVDGRDAILQADQINNGGANQCLIWQAFADRGLGYSANQGSSTSITDGTEAFDMPPTCNDTIIFKKTANVSQVNQSGSITYTLTAENYTSTTQTNVIYTDNLPANTTFVNGSSSCGATASGNVVTSTATSIPVGQTASCSFQANVNFPIASTFIFNDDMESGNANWTSASLNTAVTQTWTNTTTANSGTNAWYAENIDSESDQALTLASSYPISGVSPELRFFHSYDTEVTWDGGVVEYSTNNGGSWADLGPFMTMNGYNNGIQVNQASAISGRQAFTGTSGGYIETVVDLSSFVGQNIMIRFRFASDGFVGQDGWYVDDVKIIDAIYIENEACVTTAQGYNVCDTLQTLVIGNTCNAVAGILEQCDGQTATLDASASTGLGVMYNWTAINGGNIVSGGTTATPIVDADGSYILTVTGTDGCTQSDTLDLIVDPFQMRLYGNLPYNNSVSDIWGYTDPNGNEFALVGVQDAVSIVDIGTDPPTEIHTIPGVSITWRDLKTWDNYAYVINESASGGGLLIIDLANLTTNPATSNITTYNTALGVGYTDSHNIFIDENGVGYLFGATCSSNPPGQTTNRGTLFIDIASNPTNPTYLGMYPQNIIGTNETYIHDGFVRGDTMWASHIYGGTFGVIDVSNKAATFSTSNGTIMALQPTPGDFTHACWVTDDGKTLVAVDEVGGNSGLGINSYDVSNLNNIIHLDNIQSFPGTNVTPHNVFIKGDFVVTSYYTSGVVITDISDPSNMVIVENYDTSPNSGGGFSGCWGVYPYFPSGKIVASDRQQGLFVLGADCNYASRIEGTITDQSTGNPIPNAMVDILNYSDEETMSDVTGFYSTGIPYCGSYDVVYSAPCYKSDTITVNFVNDSIINLDVQLEYICCAIASDAGDLVVPTGEMDPIVVCQGDDLGAFTHNYTAADETDPGATHEYAYILTSDDAPNYTIINYNATGDFNFASLSVGTYAIWGISYDTGNPTTSVTTYLSNLAPANIAQIQQDIANGTCVDIGNLYASNRPAEVIVQALPAAPTISANGPTTFCEGDNVVLTSSLGNGYLWSDGSTTQSITVDTTGNYTVQVTDANGCLSPPSTVTVTKVNPLPAQPTITPSGATSFCAGGSVTLTSSTASGYLWSNGATSPNITVTTPGTYSVQVTDTNGCTSVASIPVTVIVNTPPATPTITTNGSTTICQGDDVILTSSAGFNYLWSTGATSQSITVSAAGNYSVQIIDANGCISASSTDETITVNPLPNANFFGLAASYCVGDNVDNLFGTSGTFSGVGMTGSIFDPNAVPSNLWGTPIDITYTVTENGCINSSTQQTVVNTCVTSGLELSVNVLLEGAYDNVTGLMRTELRQQNLIPLSQPYNTAPWNYTGTEAVSNSSLFPTNMVDWVLVELREGTPQASGSKGTTLMESKAGLLLDDGSIVAMDGVSPLTFNQLSIGVDYHVLVRHRNHLDIISNNTVTGATSMNYDFRTAVNMAFGTQQLKAMPNGQYAMFGADYTTDAVIQISDFTEWKTNPSLLFVYYITDGNLDGVVQATDYDLWVPNKAKLAPVEVTLP